MKKDNLQEIKTTLEKIREENYSMIPIELISVVIDIQFAYQDNRVQAKSQTHRAIKAYIDKEVK